MPFTERLLYKLRSRHGPDKMCQDQETVQYSDWIQLSKV